MTKHRLHLAVTAALALAVFAPLGAASAQDGADGTRTPRRLEEIIVPAEITYRDRSDAIAPTLSYDLEYFQRFEPLTVGDMLKRVPGVAFVSDVLEYDGARLRGLDPGYTQILINGRKVPGAGDDRSFFVDRIPAELVERIEIVRSASANRSGDAVAGALNIVLRDAYAFDGAYIRAGALHFDDGEWKGTYGAVAGGEVGGGRLLAGVNVQGRYNPKEKRSDRFDEPGGEFDNREDQSDVRDGTDYSANVSYTHALGAGELELSALYVKTDREETEQSFEYADPVSTSRDDLLSINDQLEEIDQDTWTVGAVYDFAAFGGRNQLEAGYAVFQEDTVGTEEESSFDDEDSPPSFDEREGTRTLTDIEDTETSFSYAHERSLGSATLEVGFDYQDKDRDVVLDVSEVDIDEEGAALPPYVEFERAASTLEERRADPYVMLSGTRGTVDWETGVRYETTDVDVAFDGEDASNDYDIVLPSAHLRWNLSDADRLSFSVARTVRRPNFTFLLPLTLEEEYGDNDFAGNPQLEPEKAWGVDLGFERRLGRDGVIGINAFYRDVEDLIELVNTGEPAENEEGFLLAVDNVGDGSVYGIELDLSTPLSAIGLPSTGLFLNYAWLDSEVDDTFGERRFNDQAKFVYNVGFIHDFADAGFSFGVSYRKQGDAYSRLVAEEVTTQYDADLEAFVEKRFGDNLAVRLTGSNLLDASKDEIFEKFDSIADQIDRDYDEFERETESSGRVYQLIARYSF